MFLKAVKRTAHLANLPVLRGLNTSSEQDYQSQDRIQGVQDTHEIFQQQKARIEPLIRTCNVSAQDQSRYGRQRQQVYDLQDIVEEERQQPRPKMHLSEEQNASKNQPWQEQVGSLPQPLRCQKRVVDPIPNKI